MKRNWTARGISNKAFHLSALQRSIVQAAHAEWVASQKGKIARKTFEVVERFEEAATETGSISRRNNVRAQIAGKSVRTSDKLPEIFFDKIQEEVGKYKAAREIAKACTPAMVRRNLKKLGLAAEKLCDLLQEIDFNSRQLLQLRSDQESQPIWTFTDIFEHAFVIKNAVHFAQESADQYAEGARRHAEPERVELAYGVAAAIGDHLQIKPSCSSDGLFVALLSAVMEIATGSGKDVRDLAALALKAEAV